MMPWVDEMAPAEIKDPHTLKNKRCIYIHTFDISYVYIYAYMYTNIVPWVRQKAPEESYVVRDFVSKMYKYIHIYVCPYSAMGGREGARGD